MGINLGPLLNNIGRKLSLNFSLGDITSKVDLEIKNLPQVIKTIMENSPAGGSDDS